MMKPLPYRELPRVVELARAKVEDLGSYGELEEADLEAVERLEAFIEDADGGSR